MMILFQTKRKAMPLAGVILTGFIMASCGSSDSSSTSTAPDAPPAPAGTTVQVSVKARDDEGDQLHYRWAATEGTINNVDAPSTTWTIPPGSGLQFAYVLVSDNKGGYTESRAAALTGASVPQGSALSIAPAAPPERTGFVWGELYYTYNRAGRSRNVYLPGWEIKLTGNGQTFPTTTDMKGEFFLSNLPAGTYTASYAIRGEPRCCFIPPTSVAFDASISVNLTSLPTSPSASSYIRQSVNQSLRNGIRVIGHVSLADGSLCGIRNEFFTHSTRSNMLTDPSSASVVLTSATDTLRETLTDARVNHYGDYLLATENPLQGPTSAILEVHCEDAPFKEKNITVPASGDFPVSSITIDSQSNPVTPNTKPVITGMTVTLGGRDIGRPDLPKATTLLREMELAPGDDAFLTYKGIDTRKSACAYYKAIGAVQDCDPDGFPDGAQLTLSQWRSTFNLSPFSNGNPANPPSIPEVNARYINSNDLNLARDMQAIKLEDDAIAYNVCNFPGPQDVNNPLGAPKQIGQETQPDINLAIENVRRGIGMVACVAMDFSVTPGLNGGQPFTKFYTFGPTGKLLLSVSLDGRREKFMPGSCTACHGGDFYGGRYPDDGSGSANIGSYFLPFSVANFAFSTNPGSTRTDLLPAFQTFNKLLHAVPASITQETRDLVDNWYHITNPPELLDPNVAFTPDIYFPAAGPNSQNRAPCTNCHFGTPRPTPGAPHDAHVMYQTVVAPICRTCHIATYNVPDRQFTSVTPRITFETRPPSHYLKSKVICGGSNDLKLNHTMPNTLVAFERFWLSAANIPTGTPNGPASLSTFSGACPDPLAPSPHPEP